MTKKEYIANLNSFITHFQDMIKDYDKGKIHPSFDREQAEKDIETFNAAIQALEQEPKWIPITERLPEKSDRYLAYIVNEKENKLQYIMTCDYSEGGYWNWFPDDECASDNVIAWMPLPQPYKAEGIENEK